MESRKMVLMNLFAGKEQRVRYWEWTCEHSGGRREWMSGESSIDTHTHTHTHMTMCKIESWWEVAI